MNANARNVCKLSVAAQCFQQAVRKVCIASEGVGSKGTEQVLTVKTSETTRVCQCTIVKDFTTTGAVRTDLNVCMVK
jgi:hypothetical protein